jgi:catechol 2,3-dioxygenase-like lactoylglutathione lyase family enzyme
LTTNESYPFRSIAVVAMMMLTSSLHGAGSKAFHTILCDNCSTQVVTRSDERATGVRQAANKLTGDGSGQAGEAATVLDLRAHHVTLSVANINIERDWYHDKLGFAPGKHTEHGSDLEVWQLNIPGYRMDLVRAAGSQRPKTPSPDYLQQGWAHIAFTAADLSKAFDFLKSAATDVTPTLDDHQTITKLTLHDPEGNQIEIFSR